MEEEIDLSTLEPLIAKPSSPGNVVRVAEVAGLPIGQAVLGSSANPGLRDLAVPALMVEGRQTHDRVSFDINPASRQTLETLTAEGYLLHLIAAGARVHQSGCMGCIGMGQAPATDEISLRTMPRNFPGRSGTREDKVYLCSPETATASALTGVITDPRELDMAYPRYSPPSKSYVNVAMLVAPLPGKENLAVELVKGPNIASLPEFEALAPELGGPVLLKVGNDISTDEILPAGAQVLPFRSNIPAIADFAFWQLDESYSARALEVKGAGGHLIVAGDNYGQGSSREHAALAPRYLGLRAVIARSFARIHWQNLVNFGVLPLTFADPSDYDRVEQGDVLHLPEVEERVRQGRDLVVENRTKATTITVEHRLSARQVEVMLAGSLITLHRATTAGVEGQAATGGL
ncbi:MAG: aconitase family protein, partial [Actinomycetota bacterium]|nr:aconitase family protein [Actinomycetota bacterium]